MSATPGDATDSRPDAPWPERLRRGLRFAGALRRPRPASGRGFSTSEVLVVVAIIGIMVLFTTPALIEFFRAMKVRTAAQRVVSHVRLCRQVAVSRRTPVTLVLQTGQGTSSYQAWEDPQTDQARDADGPDGILGNDDDEPWVVRPVGELNADDVAIMNVYNDLTPATYDDTFGDTDSVLLDDGTLFLRFLPDGQVKRLDEDGNEVDGDTLLRIRMEGQVGPNRLDRWYGSVNRPGKVQTDFIRNPAWQ